MFDYDNKKDYRFLITQGKNVLMLNSKGKTVSGFKYKANNTITSQPQHFKIGTKDYIVFSAQKALNILDRTGKTRVNVKEAIQFNNNTFFIKNKKFSSYFNNGKLLQVDTNGKVRFTPISLEATGKINALGNTFAYIIENKLTIKDKTVELDFGDYTKPQLFYSNNKIFVATTDLQTQKIYVFNSNAKLLPNFPVFGNATIDLKNTNNLEIITKGDAKSILFYTKN